MQCQQRDKLNKVLESALRELQWLCLEEAKIGATGTFVEPVFGASVLAQGREQEASSDYNHHVVTHGCVTRQQIESILKRRLDVARMHYLAASAIFDRFAADTPSGLPTPDGVLRIEQCGRRFGAALDSYVRALKPFTDFLLFGTLAENLSRTEDVGIREAALMPGPVSANVLQPKPKVPPARF